MCNTFRRNLVNVSNLRLGEWSSQGWTKLLKIFYAIVGFLLELYFSFGTIIKETLASFSYVVRPSWVLIMYVEAQLYACMCLWHLGYDFLERVNIYLNLGKLHQSNVWSTIVTHWVSVYSVLYALQAVFFGRRK